MPSLAEKTSANRSALVLFGSLVLHASLLSLARVVDQGNPPLVISPLRFAGKTFDIETLSESEGSTSSNKTHASNKPPKSNASETNRAPTTIKKAPQRTKSRKNTEKTAPRLSEKVLAPGTAPDEERTKLRDLPPNVVPESDPKTNGVSSPSPTKTPGNEGASYGQDGPPAETADLKSAYLKTLPLAAKLDPIWSELPTGSAGSIEVTLSINDKFKLDPVLVHETISHPAPPHLKRMAQKNRAWLLHGRFALPTQKQTGRQRLRIEATISMKDADLEAPDAPGTRALGTLGGAQPNGAYFTYFSGRHVELRVTTLD